MAQYCCFELKRMGIKVTEEIEKEIVENINNMDDISQIKPLSLYGKVSVSKTATDFVKDFDRIGETQSEQKVKHQQDKTFASANATEKLIILEIYKKIAEKFERN